jgi:hypothetical protein
MVLTESAFIETLKVAAIKIAIAAFTEVKSNATRRSKRPAGLSIATRIAAGGQRGALQNIRPQEMGE